MEDYHILNQIGGGSYGRVFRARRKYTGMIVAIKMIPKHSHSSNEMNSFFKESAILRKVKHNHIIRLIDVFETEKYFCIVSEFAEGDLRSVILKDQQALSEADISIVAAQLVSALHYLHSMRIIHRDIKPENVLISSEKFIKLCDFGFARSLSPSDHSLHSMKGTPLYMAPELVLEEKYDEKVDVWTLGIILYELYYGRTPYVSEKFFSCSFHEK
jgi:fused-like protein